MRFALAARVAAAAAAAAAVVAVASSCGCATTIAVDAGHAAVVLDDAGRLTTLGEGAADVAGLVHADDFDLRQQVQGGSFTARSADGVPLAVRDPIVSYTLVPDELCALDRELGPDGVRPLVAAVTQATVARVLADYRWDALDPDHIREAQARIIALAGARLRPHHVALDSVELKGIVARLPGLARDVTATSILAERAATARTRVDVARERADSLRARGEGIAAANREIAPSLDDAVLAAKADDAWKKLLASPNVTVMEVSP